MKLLKLTATLGALVLTGAALAAPEPLVTLVRAIEMSPSNMILPASTNGLMTFRPCADDEGCEAEHERARLTADTQYSINGRGVKYEEFRKEFPVFKADGDAYALLSVDTRSGTITSIQLQR